MSNVPKLTLEQQAKASAFKAELDALLLKYDCYIAGTAEEDPGWNTTEELNVEFNVPAGTNPRTYPTTFTFNLTTGSLYYPE